MAVDEPQSHALTVEQAAQRLRADLQTGLAAAEVTRRQEQYGPNSLTRQQRTTVWQLLWQQVAQPLVLILLGATVLTAAVGEWVDAGVILGVVLVNAAVGFLNESRALRAIESLARSLSATAQVVRDGGAQKVPAADLVPGDLVLLAPGDRVPADLRLVQGKGLRLDESALTGESLPVEKGLAPLPAATVLADRVNLAFSSTLVTHGSGRGLVYATGDRTEIGRINRLLAETVELETPLTRKIKEFSGVLLYVILALAGLGLAVGVLRGQPFVDIFLAVVSLAVAAIPEGLPAAMTIVLAIGVGRMARRNAIIRKLPAVETLGSTTIICSDKTGTLTSNRMTVTELVAGRAFYRLAGDPPRLQDVAGTVPSGLPPALTACLEAGVLCNDARMTPGDGSGFEGDPTEMALLVAADRCGLDRAALAAHWPRQDELPFSSESQFMATLHVATDGRWRLCLKGSVEALLPVCTRQHDAAGALQPLDVAAIEAQAQRLSAEGLRVLLLAECTGEGPPPPLDETTVRRDLVCLGLQGMIDPPRSEATAAVHACQQAGIRVRMVTGDHAGTAGAIADQVGLQGVRESDGRLRVLTGAAIARLGPDELGEALEQTAVCARVAPEQKLRIVQALQARHAVVAMTGDGVNDAPALRQADIGVAMGMAGTEVAKEAADMVLTDDNFAAIGAAVEEGRGVYDNLIKFITWTLPTNIGEGLVILIAIFANLTLPVTPLQILWINMTTAVLLGMMLAFEPKEPDIMRRPPRNPQEPILGGVLVRRIFVVGLLLLAGAFGLFHMELRQGAAVELARTAAVNVFVFGEMFYLWNCRSLEKSVLGVGFLTNRMLLVGMALMVALQLLFTYLPAMQRLFATAPLGAAEWLAILGYSAFIFAVVALEKTIRRVRARTGGG